MSPRISLLIPSAISVLYQQVNAARMPLAAWLAFALVQAVIWGNALYPFLAGASIIAFLVAYLTKVWPLSMIGVYAIMEASLQVVPNVYDRDATPDALWPLRLGLALFVGCWVFVGYTFPPVKSTEPVVRDVSVPSYWLLLALLFVGAIVDLYRYRNTGIPLFSDQVDVVRFQLAEETNMVLGLLGQAWTLGLMLAVLRMLLAGRIRLLNFLVVGAFMIGSLAGGSRNTLLIGLVPPLFVLITLWGAGRSAIRGRMLPRWLFVLAVVGGGMAVMGMFYFAGQRVLNGQGIYETWIQNQTQGNPWRAAMHSADLSLSAPLETWSRLFQYTSVEGLPRQQLNVLGGAQFLIEPLGFQASMYDLTAYLSRPLFMNVATLVAAPFIDFGIWGAMLFLALLGTGFGLIDGGLQRATSIYGVLGRGYLIYVGVFGVYEFLPYLGPSWLPIAAGLFVLHAMNRWTLVWSRQRRRTSLPAGAAIEPGALSG